MILTQKDKIDNYQNEHSADEAEEKKNFAEQGKKINFLKTDQTLKNRCKRLEELNIKLQTELDKQNHLLTQSLQK